MSLLLINNTQCGELDPIANKFVDACWGNLEPIAFCIEVIGVLRRSELKFEQAL